VVPPGGACRANLIDFIDLVATFADLAVPRKCPEGVKNSGGAAFAPQLARAKKGNPREWIFVHARVVVWYARDVRPWKLNGRGNFSMQDPRCRDPVAADSNRPTPPKPAPQKRIAKRAIANLNPARRKFIEPRGHSGRAPQKAASPEKYDRRKSAQPPPSQSVDDGPSRFV